MSVAENNILSTTIWNILRDIYDPEVPVLSIVDLGIVRDVVLNDESATILITPTYTGCPAMDVIRMNIKMRLLENGLGNVEVKTILSPAWTTDWLTEKGRQQLKAFGIAPPNETQSVCSIDAFAADEAVQCPRCLSFNTKAISRFGSTACKALYQCNDCHEPFDYFKCH